MTNFENPSKKGPKKDETIEFSSFTVDVKIPSNPDDFVDLYSEEGGEFYIDNLKEKDVMAILKELDPKVLNTFKTKKSTTLKYRNLGRKINFDIELSENGLSITGRNVKDEKDYGEYCHEFELIGITADDWEKLKSLF